eukprot:gene10385-2517_t
MDNVTWEGRHDPADEFAHEEVDPRVEMYLEQMNSAMMDINSLEKEIEDTKSAFEKALSDGEKTITRALPYYKASFMAEQKQEQLQHAIVSFQQWSNKYTSAKKRVATIEKPLENAGQLTEEQAQELNKATMEFVHTDKKRKAAEALHCKLTKELATLEKEKENQLRNRNKTIAKAKLYFSAYERFHKIIQGLKGFLSEKEEMTKSAKNRSKLAMDMLNKISEEIHERRQKEKINNFEADRTDNMELAIARRAQEEQEKRLAESKKYRENLLARYEDSCRDSALPSENADADDTISDTASDCSTSLSTGTSEDAFLSSKDEEIEQLVGIRRWNSHLNGSNVTSVIAPDIISMGEKDISDTAHSYRPSSNSCSDNMGADHYHTRHINQRASINLTNDKNQIQQHEAEGTVNDMVSVHENCTENPNMQVDAGWFISQQTSIPNKEQKKASEKDKVEDLTKNLHVNNLIQQESQHETDVQSRAADS